MVYTKTYYKKSRFRVKKPIRSFRDLEVYQRTVRLSIEVIKKIIPILAEKDCPVKEGLEKTCLEIPRLISEAHSRRFEHEGEAFRVLDDSMVGCNKAVVYLEQARDIYSEKIDRAICEDLIKRYTYIRRKIFNLYKAWQRFQIEDAK